MRSTAERQLVQGTRQATSNVIGITPQANIAADQGNAGSLLGSNAGGQASMQLDMFVAMKLDGILQRNSFQPHLGDPKVASCASSPSPLVSSSSAAKLNTTSCVPSRSLLRGKLVTCRLCGVGPRPLGGCSSLRALAGCRAGQRRARGRLPPCSGNCGLFSCGSRRSLVTPSTKLASNSSWTDPQAGS